MKDQRYNRTLERKKVIVMGAASGTGLATIALAVDEGAHVTAVSPDKKTIEEEIVLPYGSSVHVTDLKCEDHYRDLFEMTGEFDHLVYIASDHICPGTVGKGGFESARFNFVIWFKSLITAIKYGAPLIRAGGSISVSTATGFSVYSDSPKTDNCIADALVYFIRVMAIQLAPVRVNCVTTVSTPTAFYSKPLEGGANLMKIAGDDILVGRPGEPEDLALALIYLMKQQFGTGQNLLVDGGLLLTMKA